MMRSFLLLSLAASAPSCLDDLHELVFGQKPIEDKPLAAAPVPGVAASETSTSPGEPDPRLRIKLPGGGEASYEYAEAKRLTDRGQHTAASFVLMPKALSESGTADELDLLAIICTRREDDECVATVAAHKKGLGKNAGALSLDDLKKLAKKSPDDARSLLSPKLTDGTLTAQEAAVLVDVCKKLKDDTCVGMASAVAGTR